MNETRRADNALLDRVQAFLDEHASKPRGELIAAIAFIAMLVGAFYVLHFTP